MNKRGFDNPDSEDCETRYWHGAGQSGHTCLHRAASGLPTAPQFWGRRTCWLCSQPCNHWLT